MDRLMSARNNVDMRRPIVSSQRKELKALDKRAGRHAKSDSRMFGSSLADVFSTPSYDCRLIGSDQNPEFAVTRRRARPTDMEKAPLCPPCRPYRICVSLLP